MKYNISIIGSGNVAWHLINVFKKNNINVSGFWARNDFASAEIQQQFSVHRFDSMQEVKTKSNIVIMAINDDAISAMSSEFADFEGILAHTSGSVSIDSLSDKIKRPAVFYPLQTFTKGKEVDFKEVPIFIETKNEEDQNILQSLAKQISDKVYKANSEQRLFLHISAVFAGNYSNFMYIIAEDILKRNNLPFDALHPLIKGVVEKTIKSNAYDSMTGPARRHDVKTLQLHSEMLKQYEQYANIYKILADEIGKLYA